MRCGDCRHWLRWSDKGMSPRLGSCKRFPPVIDPKSMTQAVPTLGEGDWCGEFQRPEGEA